MGRSTRAFLEVRIIVSEARRSRSLYQWPSVSESPSRRGRLPSLLFLSLSLSPPRSSKGLGEIVTIGEVTGSPVPSDCTVASVVSRLGAKGARNLFVLVVIGRRLLLLLPPPLAFCSSASAAVSSLRNKVTAERSATLKPRAGNGSRRPEAKYVPRILSDRDGGGAVLLCFCTRTVYRSRSHP